MRVRVLREARAEPGEAGLARQERLDDVVAADGMPALLAWRSPPALIVAGRDRELPNFAEAQIALAMDGWPVLVRRSGGGACPVGEGTLQLALVTPAVEHSTIDRAYREMAGIVTALLSTYALPASMQRIEAAFCPGRYDVTVRGRKIAGLCQHWRRCRGMMIVTTAASIVVDEDPHGLCTAVNRFYRLAGGTRYCVADAVTSMCLAQPGPRISREALVYSVLDRLPAAVPVGHNNSL